MFVVQYQNELHMYSILVFRAACTCHVLYIAHKSGNMYLHVYVRVRVYTGIHLDVLQMFYHMYADDEFTESNHIPYIL